MQVFIGFSSGNYEAVVLVEDAPDFTVVDQTIVIGSAGENTSSDLQLLAEFYECPMASVAKATSRHYSPTRCLSWCASGSWSATSISVSH